METTGRFVTVKQVAEMLGVARKTVVEWIHKGELRAILLGQKAGWRIERDSLEEFLRRRANVRDGGEG